MRNLQTYLYFALNTVVFLLGWVLWLSGEKCISGSLIAAGGAGYVMFWATSISITRSDGEAKLLGTIRSFGISDVNDRRLLNEQYAAARKRTTERLDIMGFGLRNFIEDCSADFAEWSKSFEIRILVVNPTSPYCKQRDYEEKDKAGKIKADVLYATKIVRDLNNPRVKLRWYSAIPTTNVLRMDNVMWVGPYFIGERSRNAYVLTLQRDGVLFRQYLTHFERIWTDPNLSCEPDSSKIT